MLENGFSADALRIQEYREHLRQEQRLAERLRQRLESARRLALPEDVWRYDALLREAARLVRYFSAMGDQMDTVMEQLAKLSLDIRLLLSDTSSDIRRETRVFFSDGRH